MTSQESPRPRFGSIAELQSSRLSKVLIESKTKIIRGLFALAPKRRRSRVRWVLAVALVAVVGILALDVSVREYTVTHATAFYRAHVAVPATSASPNVALASLPLTAAMPSPPAVIAPASPTAMTSVTAPTLVRPGASEEVQTTTRTPVRPKARVRPTVSTMALSRGNL